jgi:rare lipoprotein A
MTRHLPHILVVVVAAALLAAPSTAFARPALPPKGPAPASVTSTDAPTQQAIDLQRSIDAVQAEQVSLDNRVTVTGKLVVNQTTALDAADAELQTAQRIYDERVVAMYQAGDYDLFSILLDAQSFTDLIGRLELFTSILESDRTALEEVSIVAAQAQYQAGQLDQLRSQEVTLRSLKDQRATSLTAALAQQQTLLASIPTASQALVEKVRTQASARRAAWSAASVPLGTVLKPVSHRVLPSAASYLGSPYHYARYRATGTSFKVVSSWYGTDFNGLTTASGETFNANDFTCAHASLPFGTWLALTRYDSRTKSTRRVVVVVNDRGPYADGRTLDVSQAAADALGLTSVGVDTLTAQVVKPIGP